MTITEQLDRLQDICDAATKGEWTSSREDMDSYTNNPETGRTEVVAYVYRDPEDRIPVFGLNFRCDARAIVSSHNEMPKLIAALRRAVEMLEGTQCTCQQLYVSRIPVHCQRCVDINEIQELLK